MIKENVATNIFLIHDLLTEDECVGLIQQASAAGVDDQDFGRPGHPDVRGRGAFENQAVTQMLWDRLAQFAPRLTAVYENGMRPQPSPKFPLETYVASGLNPRLRFYRYYPGQRFPRHFDIAYEVGETSRSFLTVIVYLNDDAVGGDTIFAKHQVSPRRGTALVFPHELQHQGGQVSAGVKWVLRSDIMYSVHRA